MSDALVIEGLKKRYGRRGPWVLQDLTFSVPEGAICALVGANGAGKTTLFSVLAGFLQAQEGEVSILGEGPFDPLAHKGRLSILPQDAALPLGTRVEAFLEYMARLQSIPKAEVDGEITRVLQEVQLLDKREAAIGALSHGMRRRLSVASAFLGRPRLILLDEPSAGLDPEQVAYLRDVLQSYRGDCTLIVSSHNLSELEKVCDHLVLMVEGRCTLALPMVELMNQSLESRWEIGSDPTPRLDILREQLPPEVQLRWTQGEEAITLSAPDLERLDAAGLLLSAALAEQGIPLLGMQRKRDLEQQVLEHLEQHRGSS